MDAIWSVGKPFGPLSFSLPCRLLTFLKSIPENLVEELNAFIAWKLSVLAGTPVLRIPAVCHLFAIDR